MASTISMIFRRRVDEEGPAATASQEMSPKVAPRLEADDTAGSLSISILMPARYKYHFILWCRFDTNTSMISEILKRHHQISAIEDRNISVALFLKPISCPRTFRLIYRHIDGDNAWQSSFISKFVIFALSTPRLRNTWFHAIDSRIVDRDDKYEASEHRGDYIIRHTPTNLLFYFQWLFLMPGRLP